MEHEYRLSTLFDRRAQENPDELALVMGGRTYSYRKLASESVTMAGALADLGVGRGDRIGVDLPNWPEWIVCLLAASRLGAAVVPLNPTLGYHEFKYQLRHAEVKVCVVPQCYGETDYLEFFDELIAELPDLAHLITVGAEEMWHDQRVRRYSDLLSAYRTAGLEGVEGVDTGVEPLMLIYTPGTLGKPKGVELTHRNLVWTAMATSSVLESHPDDRVLGAVPLFTVFGAHVVISTILTGGCLVLMERFEAPAALDLIERHRVTVFHGVPTMFQLVMRQPSFPSRNLESLRTGIVAGSPVSAALVRSVRKWCNVEIAYGLTETGPTVAVTSASDPENMREESVGKPLEGVELKLMDVTTDSDYVGGDVGELAVRGPNVMAGYYRMPNESKKYIGDDGFFRTGDLACIENGFVKIVGRSRDLIIRGGYNIYPRELEDILRTHPAVENVAAIGVPNEILGELVGVCVVPVEGAIVNAEDIKDYVRDQVADFKVPDLVRFFDELPLTDEGKIQRKELAKMVEVESAT